LHHIGQQTFSGIRSGGRVIIGIGPGRCAQLTQQRTLARTV